MSNIAIWPIDRTLSYATTPGYSGPGSDGIERVLRIPQNSPSDSLVSYPGYSLGESYPPLHRCCWRILLPQPTGQNKNWIPLENNSYEGKMIQEEIDSNASLISTFSSSSSSSSLSMRYVDWNPKSEHALSCCVMCTDNRMYFFSLLFSRHEHDNLTKSWNISAKSYASKEIFSCAARGNMSFFVIKLNFFRLTRELFR